MYVRPYVVSFVYLYYVYFRSHSRTRKIFKKLNSALFDDPEEKRREEQVHAQRINTLLAIKWVPIYTTPPHPYLPWPDSCCSVAAPLETSPVARSNVVGVI